MIEPFSTYGEPKRKYVHVEYDQESQILLRQWCIENGFDLTVNFDGTPQREDEFNFHTTIFLTDSYHNCFNVSVNHPVSYENSRVKITGFETLGIDRNISTMIVESSGIRKLREYFENEMGMRDSWPEYKPHISISYAQDQKDNFITLNPPTFDVYFDKLIVEDAKI